jgi:biopolymer transport protein ExbB/TolQ
LTDGWRRGLHLLGLAGEELAKLIKIVTMGAMALLVVFAAIADQPMARRWMGGMDLSFYLRIVVILGLIIAAFRAWGYKREVEASQKYQRAQEVLNQAGMNAERKQRAMDELEQRLQEKYAQKEQDLSAALDQAKADFQNRLIALKEQNMKLKEEVANLMQEIKRKKPA